MNFDKIIMNPPYSKNLHLKIIEESINHLADNGECINLSPIHWLTDPLAKMKIKPASDYNKYEDSISKHIVSIDTIDSVTANNIFGINLNGDVGIYKIKKSVTASDFYESLRLYRGFDPHKFYEKTKTPKSIKDVLEKLDDKKYNNFVLINDVGGCQQRGIPFTSILRSSMYGPFKNGHHNGKTVAEVKKMNKRSTWGKIESWLCVSFPSGIEAENFYNAINTSFFRFLCYAFTNDQNAPFNFLPWMGDAVNPRTGLKGYESEWINEDFYQYFKITEDEQKLIEKTMEKYR